MSLPPGAGSARPALPLLPASSSCSSWATIRASSVIVGKPVVPLIPTPVLTWPSSITNCSGLKVDGSTSYGSGGSRYVLHLGPCPPSRLPRPSLLTSFLKRRETLTPTTTPNYGTSTLSIPTALIDSHCCLHGHASTSSTSYKALLRPPLQ